MALIPFGSDSEYAPLTTVLLHVPGPEIGHHPDPAKVQHLHPIDQPALAREFEELIAVCAGLGIRAVLVDPSSLGENRDYLYNLMYCRDLFFMTPKGAIMARMANRTRREEVRYAARTLEQCGVPILHCVAGEGTFEGADALWLRDDLVAVGVGNRTNGEGFRQVREALATVGVSTVHLPSHQTTTQHLLGTVQIVDRYLALVRTGIADGTVAPFLREHGFAVVAVPETDEVRTRQAMNIVTVRPRTILMTAGCPDTRRLYQDAGLTVAAELDVTELLKGAGGLACATGIMARRELSDVAANPH